MSSNRDFLYLTVSFPQLSTFERAGLLMDNLRMLSLFMKNDLTAFCSGSGWCCKTLIFGNCVT